MNNLRLLGRGGLDYFRAIGRAGLLLWRSMVRVPTRWESFHLLCRQIYVEGCLSLVIIVVSKNLCYEKIPTLLLLLQQ